MSAEQEAARPSPEEVELRKQHRAGRRVERARNVPVPDEAPPRAKE